MNIEAKVSFEYCPSIFSSSSCPLSKHKLYHPIANFSFTQVNKRPSHNPMASLQMSNKYKESPIHEIDRLSFARDKALFIGKTTGTDHWIGYDASKDNNWSFLQGIEPISRMEYIART
eukprot:871470_1